jgi:hypothetical protein
LNSISSELFAAAKLVRLPELLARPKHLTVGKFLQQRCKDVVDAIFGPTAMTGRGSDCLRHVLPRPFAKVSLSVASPCRPALTLTGQLKGIKNIFTITFHFKNYPFVLLF